MLLFTHAELINFEWKEADNVVFKKGNRYICSPKIENIVNLISSLGTCKLLIFPNKVVTLDGQDFILGNVIKSFLAQNNQRYEDFLITKEQFYDLTTE